MKGTGARGSLSLLAWSPPYPAEKAQGPPCVWGCSLLEPCSPPGPSSCRSSPCCSAVQLSAHTHSSSVMDSWQLSQTLTSNSKPIRGMEERLELHFPHTAFPHFRQWCCTTQQAQRLLRPQTQTRSLHRSAGSSISLQQDTMQLSSAPDTHFSSSMSACSTSTPLQ